MKVSNYKNYFQQKLEAFVFADKTSKIYIMSTEQHKKLLGKFVHQKSTAKITKIN